MRRTPYVNTKNVYIRGAGIREYSRVIRGDGVGSIVSKVSRGLNKLWRNPKLRKVFKDTALKVGQKVITDELQTRIVDKTSDVINKRIDRVIGDESKPTMNSQEETRAKNRVNTMMDPEENKQDDNTGLTPFQIYQRNRLIQKQKGNGMVLPGRGTMGRKKKYKNLNATDMKTINGYINAVNNGNMGKQLSNKLIDQAKKFVNNPMKEINDIVDMVTSNIPILNMVGKGHCGDKLQTLNSKDISDMNCVLRDMNDRKPIKCRPCMSKLYRMAETM